MELEKIADKHIRELSLKITSCDKTNLVLNLEKIDKLNAWKERIRGEGKSKDSKSPGQRQE